jgi:hypothetical protein
MSVGDQEPASDLVSFAFAASSGAFDREEIENSVRELENNTGAVHRKFIETICADARMVARGIVVAGSITPERLQEILKTLAQTDDERLDALGYEVNKALV